MRDDATKEAYIHVRLIQDKTRDRFEIRVSTFVEYDDNAGRRAVSGLPEKRALVIAQEIARSEQARTGVTK
jgi:hypothetical protein